MLFFLLYFYEQCYIIFCRDLGTFLFLGLNKWITNFGLNRLHTRDAEEKLKGHLYVQLPCANMSVSQKPFNVALSWLLIDFNPSEEVTWPS